MICEGDGDRSALRALLPRIPEAGAPLLSAGRVVGSGGRGNLTRDGGIERFFGYVRDQDAVLIVLDADEDCPVDLALGLAQRIRALRPSVPAAIVAANAAFEAWFLADLESIAGKRVKSRVLIPKAEPSSDPDGIRNPKQRLIALTARGTTYKETTDQPALASMIDLDVVSGRSRSFRRLVGALQDLATAVEAGSSSVTPD